MKCVRAFKIKNLNLNYQHGTNTKKINLFTGAAICELYDQPHWTRWTLKIQSGSDQKGVCLGEKELGDFLLCKSYEWCTRHLEQTGTAVEQFERPILNHWQYFET